MRRGSGAPTTTTTGGPSPRSPHLPMGATTTTTDGGRAWGWRANGTKASTRWRPPRRSPRRTPRSRRSATPRRQPRKRGGRRTFPPRAPRRRRNGSRTLGRRPRSASRANGRASERARGRRYARSASTRRATRVEARRPRVLGSTAGGKYLPDGFLPDGSRAVVNGGRRPAIVGTTATRGAGRRARARRRCDGATRRRGRPAVHAATERTTGTRRRTGTAIPTRRRRARLQSSGRARPTRGRRRRRPGSSSRGGRSATRPRPRALRPRLVPAG